MKKKLVSLKLKLVLVTCMMVLVTFAFAGCKKKAKKTDYLGDVLTNTITVNDDGTIREIACEDFTGATYDITGLEDSIKTEIDTYNQNHGEDSVKMLQFENANNVVRIAIDYNSLDSYNGFNNTSYKIDAANTLSGDITFKDISGNDVSIADLPLDNFTAFMLDGACTLNLNKSVLYYNSFATMGADGKSVTTDGKGTAIILYQ